MISTVGRFVRRNLRHWASASGLLATALISSGPQLAAWSMATSVSAQTGASSSAIASSVSVMLPPIEFS